jgi:hypothetical protein
MFGRILLSGRRSEKMFETDLAFLHPASWGRVGQGTKLDCSVAPVRSILYQMPVIVLRGGIAPISKICANHQSLIRSPFCPFSGTHKTDTSLVEAELTWHYGAAHRPVCV